MARYVGLTFSGPVSWLSHRRVAVGRRGIWVMRFPSTVPARPGGGVSPSLSQAPSPGRAPVVSQDTAGVQDGQTVTILSSDPATIRRSRT